jgi:hypothetical protein
MTPEERFERELEVFRTEAESAIQFHFAYLAVHAAARNRLDPLKRLVAPANDRSAKIIKPLFVAAEMDFLISTPTPITLKSSLRKPPTTALPSLSSSPNGEARGSDTIPR